MKDSSQAPERNDWQEFKPLFGGGKIKICDTLRAVTPFGGLWVLIEFFARIGLVEQLENRQFYQPERDLVQSLNLGPIWQASDSLSPRAPGSARRPFLKFAPEPSYIYQNWERLIRYLWRTPTR